MSASYKTVRFEGEIVSQFDGGAISFFARITAQQEMKTNQEDQP